MKMFISNHIYKEDRSKTRIKGLIYGILLTLVAIMGLFFDSKLILKLVMYIIPLILIIHSIKIFKMALYIRKKDTRRFITFLIQVIVLLLGALFILFNPIESLNYIFVIIGILILLDGINKLVIKNNNFATSPVPNIVLGILLILFSNQIINTFYALFMIVILLIGLSKILFFFFIKH